METKCSSHSSDNRNETVITYVEFYSGIGGWTLALQQALNRIEPNKTNIRLERLADLDHSDLCRLVFHHNFGTTTTSKQQQLHGKKRKRSVIPFSIERLTTAQVEEWNATVWAMSPPCQPHTRQHDNTHQDLEDPRSRSFLRLCDLLKTMKVSKLPRVILMENVVGFEKSGSCQKWRTVLSERDYSVRHFHLTPTQVGLPNDRPRYFCVAVRREYLATDGSEFRNTFLENESTQDKNNSLPAIHTSIPALDVAPTTPESKDLPPISTFLDSNDSASHELAIPDKIMQGNSSWCFDIVTPEQCRSSCFTQSYGKFVRGTGSVLYTGPIEEETDKDIETKESDKKHKAGHCFELASPEERQFDPDWAKGLDWKRHLRYFSGTEIARLMGFPVRSPRSDDAVRSATEEEPCSSFEFPKSCTMKQQWKLLGNSLNVRVAARIAELGLRAADVNLDIDDTDS